MDTKHPVKLIIYAILKSVMKAEIIELLDAERQEIEKGINTLTVDNGVKVLVS